MKRALVFAFVLSAGLCFAAGAAGRLRLATTTSTHDSGLLDELLPPFEKASGIPVDVIPVGTGKAIMLAENGDVDVILVHDRDAEAKFVHGGFGVNRRDVMHNDFVIVGPPEDPAGLRQTDDALSALRAIAASRAPFISRGDDSGTHRREKKLWREAGVKPAGPRYLETGQGMGATLTIADEKRAYCLADRGTFISLADGLDLEVLSERDRRLLNPYGIIAVNPALHPHVNYPGAMHLIGWVTSPEGQAIIGRYRKKGAILFHPDAWGARPQ